MFRATCRRLSTHYKGHFPAPQLRHVPSEPCSAQEACTEVLARFADNPISKLYQTLDGNQMRLLSATLNRPMQNSDYNIRLDECPRGWPVPAGYHLAYFTPGSIERELAADGTNSEARPLRPFTRRMWAGGEMEWSDSPSQRLRVGQIVQETTKLISAEPKILRNGDEMLLLGVEKHFDIMEDPSGGGGIALKDRRTWIFRKEIITPEEPTSKPQEKPFPEAKKGVHIRDFLQTPVSLFRFSALTFNAHKIHYDRDWCKKVEGHRDIVVHGPLNLINILDFWRDIERDGAIEALPKRIKYRATGPLYAGEPYRLLLERKGEGWNADIQDSYGKVAMTAIIS